MEEYSVEECITELRLCSELQLHEIIPILHRLTILMKSSDTRNDLKSNHWEKIIKLAETELPLLSKNNHSEDELELLTLFLRFLRNSCGGCLENKEHVLNTPAIFNFAKRALQCFLHTQKDKLILKIAIQLFGNILLCDTNSKPVIWDFFFSEGNLYAHLLNHEDGDIKECTMMVLFHCISDENCKCLFNSKEGHAILIHVTDLYLKNQIKWTDHVVDSLLDQDTLFSCFLDLPSSNRCVFLELIYTHLDSEEESNKVFLGSVKYIKEFFVKYVATVKNIELDSYEISTMVAILCKTSSIELYMPMLQGSKDLLKACVESLKLIHILGKQGHTEFSTDEKSPVQDIKSDLIRLIGNLSYKCKENQDLVRNLDGIPLVLDCCRLDARYPFIKECCILTIRNLLDSNLDNQAIVAGITTHGDVVESDFLNKMGLVATKEDGAIRIRPAQSKV